MFLVRMGTSGDGIMLSTQRREPEGTLEGAVMECPLCHRAQLFSPSTVPAVSQVTDTGRLFHTLPGRSHLSVQFPGAPFSPAGSLVRRHPSFHSPVPGTLLAVKKMGFQETEGRKPYLSMLSLSPS